MSRSAQRVLVVDDNLQNRLVVEGHLTGSGYVVDLAEDGESGLRRFQETTPDLVLLDVLMPGLDGFETCARIRKSPGGTDTAIIFLTALSDLGTHQAALASGADDFITKPINRTELLMRVRSLLWIKRLKDELIQGYDLIRSQRDALLFAQRQREELIQLVVHDLKNPLATVVMNGQYLLDSGPLPADSLAAVEDILAAAEDMHLRTMNLLDISRSEDGALLPKPRSLDVPRLLADVRKACTRIASSRSQRVELRVEEPVPPLHADAELIQRLVENLVVNATKYSPGGTTIQLEARAVDGAIEIRVRDQGPGISPDRRESVFERYSRLEGGSTPEARTSRGLGLHFCRLAAGVHGGRIWVDENTPRGSVFCVWLPTDGPAVQAD